MLRFLSRLWNYKSDSLWIWVPIWIFGFLVFGCFLI
jgi:hypothetical protein